MIQSLFAQKPEQEEQRKRKQPEHVCTSSAVQIINVHMVASHTLTHTLLIIPAVIPQTSSLFSFCLPSGEAV